MSRERHDVDPGKVLFHESFMSGFIDRSPERSAFRSYAAPKSVPDPHAKSATLSVVFSTDSLAKRRAAETLV